MRKRAERAGEKVGQPAVDIVLGVGLSSAVDDGDEKHDEKGDLLYRGQGADRVAGHGDCAAVANREAGENAEHGSDETDVCEQRNHNIPLVQNIMEVSDLLTCNFDRKKKKPQFFRGLTGKSGKWISYLPDQLRSGMGTGPGAEDFSLPLFRFAFCASSDGLASWQRERQSVSTSLPVRMA